MTGFPDFLASGNLDYGVTGLLLIVVWRGLAVLSNYHDKRINPFPILECQTDPKHFQRIREMHAMIVKTEAEKAEGKFACNWKDRDEVRDMIEAMRLNVAAMDTVTRALTALTAELRLTRNGNGK